MKKGFTLIELLSIIVIIAIILTIAVPIITGVITKAKLKALKDSAYGLIDASNLYYVQVLNSKTLRFDIDSNKITSNDTSNLLKYKGSIKQGVSIIKPDGTTVICVSDGKNSAYKNYNESKVNLISGKVCTIPSNTYVIYLDGVASLPELSNQELTNKVKELEELIAQLQSEKASKDELNAVATIASDAQESSNNSASSSELEAVATIVSNIQTQLNSITTLDKVYPVGSIYMSAGSTSPATLFGGTWTKIEGRFLLASSSSYTLASTGGNASVSYTPSGTVGGHTLTISEMPSHSHGYNGANLGGGLSPKGDFYGVPVTTYAQSDKVGGSKAHSHSFTGTAKSIATMPPYVVVNVWKRTA